MQRFFSSILRSLDRWVTGLGTDEWAVIGVAVVIVAFISLRGFGKNSRL